ncbi:MAG: hypothetical protein ACM3P0_15490 [Acidobacteriota bacterium]
MKKNIIFILASVILLIASGCENLNNPGEIKIKNSLFFNLQANSSRQQVFIYKNPDLSGRTEYDAADPFINFFNKDAVVTLKDMLSAESTGFTLTEDTLDFSHYISYYNNSGRTSPTPYKPYYTNSAAFEVKPLTDYYLSVNADGNIITGQVTTPGDFEITSPGNAEEKRGLQNLRSTTITWNQSKNAAGYIVNIICLMRFYDFQDSTWRVENSNVRSRFWATTSCRVGDFLSPYSDVQSGPVLIRVEAYDNNYVEHYQNKNESVGLNNAYGCFSSSLMKEVRIYFDK